MFGKLYTAPAAMTDMCDSNGCLPGQIPMAGQKFSSNLDANATTTMDQVLMRSPNFEPAGCAISIGGREVKRIGSNDKEGGGKQKGWGMGIASSVLAVPDASRCLAGGCQLRQ